MVSAVYHNLVGGEWLAGQHEEPNINPSDVSDVIGVASWASAAQAQQAVQAARAAFPAWSQSAPLQRAEILERVSRELLSRKESLGQLLAREEGKTLPEGIAEVTRAAQIFGFFAAECVRMAGQLLASVRPGIAVEVTREPLGVVVLITPWNFPIAIPAWKIAPALAYGNCVVFKPAELVPALAHALADIIARSGIPAGVFNMVYGSGVTVGSALVNDADVDAISFTGSQLVGRQIASSAAGRMAKVQLEMGGKNPLLVLDDAQLTTAVNVATQGAFFSTGQRCTASSRIIVTAGIHDRFVNALRERMASLTVAHALQPGTDIGPVVDARQLQKDLEYIEIGQQQGAQLTGGHRVRCVTDGYYLAPALFTDTTAEMRLNTEEVFGPVATVQRADSYEHALQLANDTPFGLSAGIITTSLKYATHFKRHAQAGMVMVNVPTAGVDFHVPFGGRKQSSYGSREQGSYAAEFYTTVKTAYTLPE